MVEGDNVFKEAIQFLKKLPSLKPLIWDENLTKSAQAHVDDIGPKGLLLYQSSDGTEPEDRISKFGSYVDSLGENIDFGPNDAMGVIVSMTLDDGEEERPHRENLFKTDYRKVGIACGPHKTEFQMCVMDFAFDFQPLNQNEMKIEMNKEDMMNNSDFANHNNANNPNNQSPLVKLSLEPEDFQNKEMLMMNKQQIKNENINNEQANFETKIVRGGNEIDQLVKDTIHLLNNAKIVSKKVEITTKITYTYEDGSTKVVTQNESHEYKD